MVDVVVVGAGPVGLWTACELRLAGLEVALLERRAARMEQSRALTIHGRTIELFAMRGVAERFLTEGKPIATGHFASLDTRLDFSGFETRFPFTLFLPQNRTEALLEAHAADLGVEIHRGHHVESIAGDSERGYTVKGTAAHGAFRFDCRAVVGADGRRSVVRAAANIAFEGSDTSHSVMMGDVRIDAREGPPVRAFCNARGGGMLAPIDATGRVRIILIDPERSHVDTREPLSLEELSASARRVLGEDLGMRDPSWLTRFGDETRLAAAYRRGNLFVAGDAAHIHAPAGGQGMNVGLQDAMNLGWKLAAVIKGEAPDALLDSYETERRPVGAQLARNTLAQIAMMTSFDPAHLALRALMSDLLKVGELNRRLAGELSGFDITYAHDALPGSDDPAAGRRSPDSRLVLEDGTETTVHALLKEGKWLSLSFAEGKSARAPAWLPEAAVRRVRCQSSDDLVRDATSMLVRPDGYIAGFT
ncbi:FAD-dependent oxidoreductase [Paracoccus pantotrophus]|uniref:FAD-dependent oxidoreductase n=1 Tax=Paracoccus pantotrophus TaxID=82367 RepID=A0A7H9BZH7_PARPN|nr:FAD-dependent oxidoreductase [Paracoccus pantotrophus]